MWSECGVHIDSNDQSYSCNNPNKCNELWRGIIYSESGKWSEWHSTCRNNVYLDNANRSWIYGWIITGI